MKFEELLLEVKLGKNDFNEYKLMKDIEEDIDDTLEEGVRYFRASKRLEKMANRIEKKKATKAEKIANDVRKLAKIFASVEEKYKTGSKISEAFAKAKVIAIKKIYDRILETLKDRMVVKEFREKRIYPLLGGVFGTMFFAIEPLKKTGKVLAIASPQRKYMPMPIRNDLKAELVALDRSNAKNYINFASIREDEEEAEETLDD